MKYIKEFKEGSHIQGVYLCKQKQEAVTKNGKNYIGSARVCEKKGVLTWH